MVAEGCAAQPELAAAAAGSIWEEEAVHVATAAGVCAQPLAAGAAGSAGEGGALVTEAAAEQKAAAGCTSSEGSAAARRGREPRSGRLR